MRSCLYDTRLAARFDPPSPKARSIEARTPALQGFCDMGGHTGQTAAVGAEVPGGSDAELRGSPPSPLAPRRFALQHARDNQEVVGQDAQTHEGFEALRAL